MYIKVNLLFKANKISEALENLHEGVVDVGGSRLYDVHILAADYIHE